MSRWKAATIHLVVSLILACGVAALLYLLWFPPPYFIAAGASTLMLLIMGVDVAIGPLLTLIVFSQAKPKKALRLDLSVIALLQVAAFAYGLYVICEARPVFVVATVDRLMIVTADQLDDGDLRKGSRPEYRRRSWTGPVLVGVKVPTGDEASGIAFQALGGGKDLDQMPTFYVPYTEAVDSLLQRAHSLSLLKTTDASQRARILQFQKAAATKGDTLLYVPVQRGDKDYTAIISGQTKYPIAILPIDPW